MPSRPWTFIFAGFTWALWITRNKMAIEKSLPKAPTDIIYTALSLMQRWSISLKEKDMERFSQVKGGHLSWLKTFKPTTSMPTGVCEIYHVEAFICSVHVKRVFPVIHVCYCCFLKSRGKTLLKNKN